MDWQRVIFDWNRARAFLATADAGSFSGAARALGTTQPTVGRQIAALESELDVVLFERVGRGLGLTPTGLELVEHVRAMADAATQVSRVAAGQASSLDGPIVVSAGELVAAHLLPPILAEIRAEHPGITLEVISSNEVSDLGRREADIAIRNFRSSEPELVARLLCEDRAHLYATPAYLASIGDPDTPEALAEVAELVAFNAQGALRQGLQAIGLPVTEASFPWMSASAFVQWGIVLADAGIAIMLESLARDDPRVVRVLPSLPPIPVPMWLTTHREVRTSRRVRVVYDRIADGIRSRVAAQAP